MLLFAVHLVRVLEKRDLTAIKWQRDDDLHGIPNDGIDAGRDFGTRLFDEATKPNLVFLGTTVTTFYTATHTLRTAQSSVKFAIEAFIAALEPLRLQAASALFGMVGTGMSLWSATPERVNTLFDINLLRGPVQKISATITFNRGDLYQLWLQAMNSQGSSKAGPKQNWTAV